MCRLFRQFGTMFLLTAWPYVAMSQENDPQDVQQITQLIQRWAYARDQGDWEQLKATFHPEGTISISWISGPFEKFVNASVAMSKEGARTKHLLGIPAIRTRGNKALSEVDAQIMVRLKLGVEEYDLISYARFFDRLEKRSGVWRIVSRVGIYERDRLQPLGAHSELEAVATRSSIYPEAYRYLAASLATINRAVIPGVVTSGSIEQTRLYDDGAKWLEK